MEIRNGEVALHLEVDGDDTKPPVLLMHGITQSVETWAWFVPRLTPRYRVLRLDFRGHGRSGRTPGAYGLPGYVSDAVAEVVARRQVRIPSHARPPPARSSGLCIDTPCKARTMIQSNTLDRAGARKRDLC